MDLLYNVVNREFDVSSRKGRVAYLDFIAECQQDLDQLRFRKEHQFDFGEHHKIIVRGMIFDPSLLQEERFGPFIITGDAECITEELQALI